jgi:hypothetical protein
VDYYLTVLLLIAALVVFSLFRGRRKAHLDRVAEAARKAVEARLDKDKPR